MTDRAPDAGTVAPRTVPRKYAVDKEDPEAVAKEKAALKEGTANLRRFLLADPNRKRRSAIERAQETIFSALRKVSVKDPAWSIGSFGKYLTAMPGWRGDASWAVDVTSRKAVDATTELLGEADGTSTYAFVVRALGRFARPGVDPSAPRQSGLGTDADPTLGITILSSWKFSEQLQGAGLGSLILSALTTIGMMRDDTALVAIPGCDLPTFMVTDSRYGFHRQSENGTNVYPMDATANPLVLFPPVSDGTAAASPRSGELVAWTPPSLRAVFDYLAYFENGVETARKPGAYDIYAAAGGKRSHPLYVMLRSAEKAITEKVYLGIFQTNSVWEKRAALFKSPRADDPYNNLPLRIRQSNTMLSPEGTHDALRNPFKTYLMALCEPRQLVDLGILPDPADTDQMNADEFRAPLRTVAPLRTRLGYFEERRVLVVHDVNLSYRANSNKDAALSAARLLVYFFVSVARELGLVTIFDTRGDWAADFARSGNDAATVFDFDTNNGLFWNPDYVNIDGPKPFFAASERVPGVFWFYPQVKPRSFVIPAGLDEWEDSELSILSKKTAKACITDVVLKEGMPAPLLRLSALRPLASGTTAAAPDASTAMQARYVACTHCAHPAAQFMTADGAYAFCGAHCQRHFEDGTDAM